MLTFKQYITEYLTDEQREMLHRRAADSEWKNLDLAPEAKARTDHFFGKGVDIKHEKLQGYVPAKSEIHNQVEQHLGRPITPEEYQKGRIKDDYGRDVKIGRMIKNDSLRNKYASDTAREGVNKDPNYRVSIVRGVEVGGQTNNEPDENHPKGHSWKDISCKNITNGAARDALIPEIKSGTVVVRVHDNTGQEIHRSTLHPFIHEQDHPYKKSSRYVYAINSSYGVMHPSFIKHAEDVARRLTSGSKGLDKKNPTAAYFVHRDVYDDQYNGHSRSYTFHPELSSAHLMHEIKTTPANKLDPKVLKHPNITGEHISAAINRTDFNDVPHLNMAVASSDKLTPEHINQGIDNRADSFLVKAHRFSKDKFEPQHYDRMADNILSHYEKGYTTKHNLTHVMRRMIIAGGPKPKRFNDLKKHVPDIDSNPYTELLKKHSSASTGGTVRGVNFPNGT